MSQNSTLKKVCDRIDGFTEEMVKVQAELTAIPALGPENEGQGELEKSEYVKSLLKALPIDELDEVHALDKRVSCGFRPNLLAKIKGKSNAKTIWILSHLDVVPAGDLKLWQSDPFKMKIDNGKLIGRGVEDNQQGLVSSLFAIKALCAEGIIPEYDVGLAIVADEETGSQYGLQYVLEKRPNTFRKADFIIVPDAGDIEGKTIEVAEKSILWLKFQTVGKQCHASTPEQGINAHRAAAFLITRLNSLYETFSSNDPVFDPPISTFEPTKKEANVPNVNTIPGEDVFYLDCRILPKYSIEDVEAEISNLVKQVEDEFKVSITTSSPQRVKAATPTPTDAPVVLALSGALSELHGIKAEAIGIGGGTVAAHFRQAGFNAAVWSTLEDTAHQPNEYSLIKNMVEDAKIFAHVYLQK